MECQPTDKADRCRKYAALLRLVYGSMVLNPKAVT